MIDKNAIASRIKTLRGDLSQNQFAKNIGYKQAYVSEIETAKTKPSIDFLTAVSKKHKVTIDWLVVGKLDYLKCPRISKVPIGRIKKVLKLVEESLSDEILELDKPKVL